MRYLFAIIVLLFISCDNPLTEVMQSNHQAIQRVKDSIDQYEVQILYTQIDTTETGEVQFTDYSYQVDEDTYFYPASTVKLPIAIMAATYADQDPQLSLDIPYVTERDKFKHSIADDIAAIFAVSDNEAYNRLYEIIGRDFVNTRFREKKFPPIRISHRLSTSRADKRGRVPVKFFPGYVAETILLENQGDGAIEPLDIDGVQKGIGVYRDKNVDNTPMDFSLKNYFPLETQHEVMKRLIFPENFTENERFSLTDQTRERLLSMMQTLRREAGYISKEYYDSYVKFFLYGDSKDRIPDHITIYNKVGYAYGTLTETAYIVDTKENIRFLLSATILVNKNGIFNDDVYEYEEVGIPFLAQLGREIHSLEKGRK